MARQRLRIRQRPAIETLEGRQLLVAFLGLTTTGDALVPFDTDSPGTVAATVAISGLQGR